MVLYNPPRSIAAHNANKLKNRKQLSHHAKLYSDPENVESNPEGLSFVEELELKLESEIQRLNKLHRKSVFQPRSRAQSLAPGYNANAEKVKKIPAREKKTKNSENQDNFHNPKKRGEAVLRRAATHLEKMEILRMQRKDFAENLRREMQYIQDHKADDILVLEREKVHELPSYFEARFPTVLSQADSGFTVEKRSLSSLSHTKPREISDIPKVQPNTLLNSKSTPVLPH